MKNAIKFDGAGQLVFTTIQHFKMLLKMLCLFSFKYQPVFLLIDRGILSTVYLDFVGLLEC